MQAENDANGTFRVKGTITFPEREELVREVAAEIPLKPFPWGWIFLGGSLLLSLIISLSVKK